MLASETMVHDRQAERSGASAPSEEDLRARALLVLVPALVHRLNNALAVALGVHDLGPRAPGAERELAHAELSGMSQILARLADLARPPARPAGPQEVESWLRAVALLVRPLAASLGYALDLRVEPAHVIVDGRLAGLVVALCCAHLAADDVRPRRRLRLSARPARGGVRLALHATGSTRPSSAIRALEAHARDHGLRFGVHATAGAFGLALVLPALGSAGLVAERAPPGRARRVLLLHHEGQERELVATVLAESGCAVSESAREPREGGNFDLVLVQRRLALEDPSLSARLRARADLGRVVLLEPRLGPGALLALLRD
jgi:hypothetical protein